jgi:flagellar biosynthetic protein FliQ
MNEADALDIVQFAVWTVLTASAPVVLVAMAVGIGIALIQALTQIQEITLTFVPKIVAIMLVVALTGPFIGSQISAFTNVIFERIQTGFLYLRHAQSAGSPEPPPIPSWLMIFPRKGGRPLPAIG